MLLMGTISVSYAKFENETKLVSYQYDSVAALNSYMYVIIHSFIHKDLKGKDNGQWFDVLKQGRNNP